MLYETKGSVEHLIIEAASAENIIEQPLDIAYQLLPNTTLMWCSEWVEPPLYSFVSKLSCNMDNVSFFDTFSDFFLRSKKVNLFNQIAAIVPQRDKNPLNSHNTTTGVHGCNYLNMDSASGETSEHESLYFQ